MSAVTIFTIIMVILVLVWLVQLLLLYRMAEDQGGDPIRVVSGATIFFPIPVPVAQMAPGLVDSVGGFWESLFGGFSSGRGGSSQPSGAMPVTEATARLLVDGREVPLTLPRIRLGRYPNNEVVIENSTVSAYHAEIIRRPDNRHEIVDRESRNGTRVNGALIRSQILKDGDLITLGGATLHYLSTGQTARPGQPGMSAEPPPPAGHMTSGDDLPPE